MTHVRTHELQQDVVRARHRLFAPIFRERAGDVLPPRHENETVLQGRCPEAACCGRAHAVHHQDDEREVHEPALPSIVPRGPCTNQLSASPHNNMFEVDVLKSNATATFANQMLSLIHI